MCGGLLGILNKYCPCKINEGGRELHKLSTLIGGVGS